MEDTGRGDLTGPAGIAGWPELCVRVCMDCDAACAPGEIYDAAGAASQAELNQRQRAMAPVRMAGLLVQRRIYVPSAGQANADGFIRYLDTLTNDGGAPITVAVRIGTVRPGGGGIAEAGATLWRTHSDDAVAAPSDRWLLLDDEDPEGSAAALGILVFGSGARFAPARLATDLAEPGRAGAVGWEYRDVTVQPGQTVILLSSIVHEGLRVAALDEVEHLLEAQPVDLLFGLDEATRRAIANFDVDPANAAPLADAGGPYNATEGSQVALSAVRSYDAEGAVLQYTWDLDDDGEFDDAQGANAFVTFNDDGAYPVAVRVQDPGGKADVHAAIVSVRNVAPRIDGVVTDSPIDEGQRLSVEVRITDPGADQILLDFDWDGDGTYDEVDVADRQYEHRYLQDGMYMARVRVRDDDGGSSERDFPVVVGNRGPEIQQFFAASPVLEGAEVAINTVASDAGGDPITYCYDLDNDGAYERCGPDLAATTTVFNDNGLYTIRVRVADDQGASTTRDFQVSVLNARPEIRSVTNTGPVLEGSPVIIDVDAFDRGAADVLDFSFDLDNDGRFDEDVAGQADPFVEHTFRQQGVHIVGVRVRDDDGAFASGSTEVTVNNAPPTGVMRAPQFVVEGQEFEVSVQAMDPGDDVLTYDWDFDGDGQFELLDSRQPVQRHTFPQQGDFTIRCVVDDGDGGQVELTAAVRVRNEIPRLQVDLESPQPEGAEVVIRAVADDPGNDRLLFSFDVDNDGVFEFEQQAQPFVRWRYTDDGFYTVRILVDDGNDVIDALREIEITNVAPTVRLSSNSPVNEGDEMVFTAEITDPGAADTFRLVWTVQGEEREVEVVDDESRRFRIPALDDAIFNAQVRAIDDDGGESEVARAQMIVANVPPHFVPVEFVRPAIEGQAYNLVVPAEDPAGLADPLTYGLIDPPAGVSIDAQIGLIDWVPTFDQFLASPITLTITVADGDGGTARTELIVPVLPEDVDADGIPDTFERNTCNADGSICLDPSDPDDATADPDRDGRDNLTEWEEGTDPFIYEGASVPELIAPADGSRIETLTPTFLVSAVTSDREDDELFIVYEIFADAALMDRVLASEPQPQPDGAAQNRWTPDAGSLLEDQDYYWRAAAIGGGVRSPWTAAWRFRTNAQNQPPSAPVLDSPPNESIVDTVAPTLRVLPSVDPDGDALVYKFRIYRRNGEAFTNGVGQLADGVVVFDTSGAGLSENGTFLWDVVAEDEAGALSEPSERWGFTIDTENQGPSVPVILAPTEGMLVTSLTPECVAGQVRDDDDTEVGYVFRVRLAGAAEYLEESEPVVVPQGEDAHWAPTVPLVEDTDHTLEVHAVDDGGSASAPASVTFFVSAVDHPPPQPMHQTPLDGGKVRLSDACVTWTPVEDPERTAVTYVVTYCLGSGECGESVPLMNQGFCLGNRVEAGKTYQWQVEAFDEGGNSAGKTAPWSFAIEAQGADPPAATGAAPWSAAASTRPGAWRSSGWGCWACAAAGAEPAPPQPPDHPPVGSPFTSRNPSPAIAVRGE
ncbi:MAG: PKD domain-containing protein [bacterium]